MDGRMHVSCSDEAAAADSRFCIITAVASAACAQEVLGYRHISVSGVCPTDDSIISVLFILWSY